MKISVINGPNINLLGIREPDIYGQESYEALVRLLTERAAELGVEIGFFQSNHEGAIVDEIQRAFFDGVDGIILNPAAYTHTSIAIADALKAVKLPTVEVHISDVSKREAYRQVSFVREVCVKTIAGEGLRGYVSALDFLVKNYEDKN